MLASARGCERRLWLRQHHPQEASPVTEHGRVLRERGDEHERAIAGRFADLEGPIWRRDRPFAEAAGESLRLLLETRRPLWQAALLTPDGRRSAQPDFLWWEADSLVVREARLALRPGQRADLALQMAHLAHVIGAAAGIEPVRFEVEGGDGSVAVLEPLPPDEYERIVRAAEGVLASEAEPDLLLAHSTCRRCMFYAHCWDRAERERRIELLPEVQPAHVHDYHALGVRTIEQLASLDPARLAKGPARAAAERAVRVAGAWRDDRAEWLQAPRLPGPPVVFFDVEGDAQGEEGETPIYLWGLGLDDGVNEPHAEALLAGAGPEGDARAWRAFLARAGELLARHPDGRWLHWDASEPLWIRRYAERLGAPAGLAERLLAACFDLKRELDRSVRLPLRSYSIKHVAPWMGFEWRNPEAGSEWSLARWHHARQAGSEAERGKLLAEVCEYNADDLWAMRAVWRWLRENGPPNAPRERPRGRPDA
ncbi:MAG: TM0106 family RecB-like putative nuclease [Candidatus Eisenbacteria bacterium]|nr:TM0106 family RecB-like putative nuclease [Candidatus Eisenbacteria bacterium]